MRRGYTPGTRIYSSEISHRGLVAFLSGPSSSAASLQRERHCDTLRLRIERGVLAPRKGPGNARYPEEADRRLVPLPLKVTFGLVKQIAKSVAALFWYLNQIAI